MKKLKGLWFIRIGLTMFVVWVCLCWFIWSRPLVPGAPPPNSFLIVLYALKAAVWLVAVRPTNTVFSLYPIMMFALIAIGLIRLVWSLFHTRGDEEEG